MIPGIAWSLIPPASDLQDFPVLQNLTPEDTAGLLPLVGILTPEVTTTGLRSPRSMP
jgi:hypothetical protein